MPRGGGHRGTITKKVWAHVDSSGLSVATGTTAGIALDGTLIGDELEEATVGRVIGTMYAIDQTSTLGRIVRIGLIVLDENATAFPVPGSGTDEDWMYQSVIMARVASGIGEADVHRFDIRSQRRFRERDRGLWMIIRNDSSVTIKVVYSIHTLMLER